MPTDAPTPLGILFELLLSSFFALVGAVVGAAVVATGVALGVIKKKKGDEETRAWREGAQLFVAPTFGGLTLQGRF